MTPEEMQQMMAQGGRQDPEASRIGAIADMYALAVRVFLQDPQKFIKDFDLDMIETQKDAEDLGEKIAEPLLGLCIGLNMGIEPFLKEEGERRWLKQAKAKVIASTPPGITPDFSLNVLKDQGEKYAQTEKCVCGASYADHSNKDQGPCTNFRSDCTHFRPAKKEGDKSE